MCDGANPLSVLPLYAALVIKQVTIVDNSVTFQGSYSRTEWGKKGY